MSQVYILDVAHGNCALVRSSGESVVIDAPIGGLLLNTLEDYGIDTVSAAFISHTDKDHIAGILSLLTHPDVKVERIYINPDAQKKTRVWQQFRAAVSVAQKYGTCDVQTSLTTSHPGSFQVGEAKIDVVTPSAALALTGVGGTDLQDRYVSANSMSSAMRISCEDQPAILLAADMDEIGLDDALHHGVDMNAATLVYPHHGGRTGEGNFQQFMTKLMSAVNPQTILFSNGHGRHDNPRAEVVKNGLQNGCKIACTQLSKRCCPDSVSVMPEFFEPIRAHGRQSGRCCAGSMTIELNEGATRPESAERRHAEFIDQHIPTPLCRG
jgi:competence protein ComEC